MSQIEFEDNNQNFFSRKIIGSPQEPALIHFLLKKGWVKNPRLAFNVLVLTSIILMATALILVFIINYKKAHPSIKNNLTEETLNDLPYEVQENLMRANKK